MSETNEKTQENAQEEGDIGEDEIGGHQVMTNRPTKKPLGLELVDRVLGSEDD